MLVTWTWSTASKLSSRSLLFRNPKEQSLNIIILSGKSRISWAWIRNWLMVCFLKKKKLHKSYWEICDRQSRRQWRLRKVRPFHQGTLFSLKAKLEGKKGKGDCMHLFLSCYILCFMAGWTSLGQGRPKQHFISGDEQSGILQKSQRAQGSSRLLHLGVTYSVFYALSGVFFFHLWWNC